MPWQAEYSSVGAQIRYTGHVTGVEILAAKKEFFAHAFRGAPRYVLCDFSPAEAFDVSTDEVMRIVEQDRAATASHPYLLEAVVASTALQYGLSRMWQQRVDAVRPDTAICKTREEALHWLRGYGVTLASEPETGSLAI